MTRIVLSGIVFNLKHIVAYDSKLDSPGTRIFTPTGYFEVDESVDEVTKIIDNAIYGKDIDYARNHRA